MSFTTARVLAAIQGAVDDVSHIQLHDGDPGGAGTNNVATEVAGREAISMSGANPSVGEAEFAITTAGGPFTHISLWNQSSGGVLQATAELSPAESFGGAGTLDVTVTATASNA